MPPICTATGEHPLSCISQQCHIRRARWQKWESKMERGRSERREGEEEREREREKKREEKKKEKE